MTQTHLARTLAPRTGLLATLSKANLTALHADDAPLKSELLGTDPNALHANPVLTDVILHGANPQAKKLLAAARLAIDDSANGLMRVAHHRVQHGSAGVRRHGGYFTLN